MFPTGNTDNFIKAMEPSLDAGNQIVRMLYETTQLQSDRFLFDPKDIRVIPFINRAYSGGIGTALPYIVTPRWGYTQSWAWPGYAHELGHHIYRNIKGLAEELHARLTTHLVFMGQNKIRLGLWYQWQEEIIADIFAVTLLGSTFVHTQQYASFSGIGPSSLQRLGKKEDARKALLFALDDEHPMAYLRVHLGLTALSLLGADPTEVNMLTGQWYSSFPSNLPIKLRADVTKSDDKRYLGIDLGNQNLKQTGEQLVGMILHMPLDSLADSMGQARSFKDVFYRKTDQDSIAEAIKMCKETINLPNVSIDEIPRQILENVKRNCALNIGAIIATSVCAFELLNIEQFQKLNKELIKYVGDLSTIDDRAELQPIKSVVDNLSPLCQSNRLS